MKKKKDFNNFSKCWAAFSQIESQSSVGFAVVQLPVMTRRVESSRSNRNKSAELKEKAASLWASAADTEPLSPF